MIIAGRRWRASDPGLPPEVAERLRQELMSARRAVGAALKSQDREGEKAARARVQAAKVALGERGTPWWEQSTQQRQARWQALDTSLPRRTTTKPR